MDASFDYSDYSGLGGKIVDTSKKVQSFFSTEVDKRTLDEVMAKGQKLYFTLVTILYQFPSR